ncbi:unnamed protein product [Discula destructiva]
MKTAAVLSAAVAIFATVSLAAPEMTPRDFFGNPVALEARDCYTCTDQRCTVAADCITWGCATACSCNGGVCSGTL